MGFDSRRRLSRLVSAAASFAQTPAPNLTRQQRELLSAIITAVDAAAVQPETNDLKWQHHIMRASDGSHYVAFSAEPARIGAASRASRAPP